MSKSELFPTRVMRRFTPLRGQYYSPYSLAGAFHPTTHLPRSPFTSLNVGGLGSQAAVESTVTGSGVEYMFIEDVEKLERYLPGGYHPIVIGDYLHDRRYRIVHKLGFDAYSTIWLARDETDDKYVAIKIAIAAGDSRESDILHMLGSVNLGNPRASMILPMLDEFVLCGPNGKHRCYVTAPARSSLAEAKDASYSRLFQSSVARAIPAQLVQVVAFLHSQGVVHGSKYLPKPTDFPKSMYFNILRSLLAYVPSLNPDLHLGNILLHLSESIDRLSPSQFYEKYGEFDSVLIERLDNLPLPKGIPTRGIIPIWLGKKSELISLSSAKIFLTDFGESFLPSVSSRYYSNTPALLIPPEVKFLPEESVLFPADIWSLTCAIWSVLGQRPLFEAFNPSDDWMTKEHVDVFGKLPSEWWEKWDARLKWFDEDGVGDHGVAGNPFARRFENYIQKPRRECGMEEVGEEEKEALFKMLKSMMTFKPDERITAKEALESAWMRKWALPDLERANMAK